MINPPFSFVFLSCGQKALVFSRMESAQLDFIYRTQLDCLYTDKTPSGIQAKKSGLVGGFNPSEKY